MTAPERRAILVVHFDDDITESDLDDPRLVEMRLQRTKQGELRGYFGDETMTPEWTLLQLNQLWDESQQVFEALTELPVSWKHFSLQITQYTSTADVDGPGIPIDARWVAALARVQGGVDIDQYVIEPESS